ETSFEPSDNEENKGNENKDELDERIEMKQEFVEDRKIIENNENIELTFQSTDTQTQEEFFEEKRASQKACTLETGLAYCFKCILWTGIISKYTANVKAFELFVNFVNDVLSHLFELVKDDTITSITCKFVCTNGNEDKVAKLVESSKRETEFEKLFILVNTYKQFDTIVNLFRRVMSRYFLWKDISKELISCSIFSENRKFASFPKMLQRYHDAFDLLKTLEQPMNILDVLRESNAFRKIWDEVKQSCKGDLKAVMEQCVTQAKEKWKALAISVHKKSLVLDQLTWFMETNLAIEISLLFADVDKSEIDTAKRDEIVRDLQCMIGKVSKLRKLIVPWKKMIDTTNVVKALHKQSKDIALSDNWNKFIAAFNKICPLFLNECKLPGSELMVSVSIEEAIQCFDICWECFQDKASNCIDFLNLCANNKSKIAELANNENLCDPEHFENTMETLDNCRDMKFQGLVSALRVACINFRTKIWDVHFQSMTDLANAILTLPSSHDEFVAKFSTCCNEDLSRISFYVEEAGKLQNQQSFDLIHAAMKRGYWIFATCEQVLSFYADGSNRTCINLDTEAFLLHVDDTTMDHEKLERSVDRVLLGYSKEKLKDAQKLVKQLEICKEISLCRIEFWQKGGKKEHEVTKLQTKEKMQVFRNKKLEWQQRLQEWNTTRMSLREKYPSFNYFCFCELRLLIKKLDDILVSDQSLWELHASRHIVPLLQRLDYRYSKGLDCLRKWHRIVKLLREVRSPNDYGSEEEELGKMLNIIWECSKNNQFTNMFTLCPLDAGKPYLIIEQNTNAFCVFELFQSVGMVPRAEHILICKSTTLEEEIECLLFRAIIAAKRASNKKAPLYCLMWPENLSEETAKKVVKLFHLLLLSETALQNLDTIPYLLVVISANPDHVLCHTLLPFRLHRPISLSEQTAQSIFSQMYCNDWTSFVAQKHTNKNPFVQLYTSERVGMGKSYKIRNESQKTSQHVCIAFNSSDIEWKFLVQNFWRYHPSQSDLAIVPNRKISDHDIIAFHLDLSSSISTEINNFLFELLFLQHVNTGQNILECFHVNHNMAFFIEIPSKLSDDKQTPQQLLYTLFGPIAFPILDVNTENNLYDYGKEAQYAFKWIREFDANHLKSREEKKIFFIFKYI
ncbi:hypothetical protein RFI_39064, partial [Reticulomyxa filosa]